MSSQAEATINHFGHPHPLQLSNHLLPLATCSGCMLQATGLIYSCRTCNYFLHPNCSKMPQQITHPFDKDHVLSLFPKPLYQEGLYSCDACGKQGQGFCYHCELCKTDLHILCAAMPLNFTHQSHCHPLKLMFSPPHFNKIFNCDVCNTLGSNHWLYRCEICDYDVHLSCTNIPAQPLKQASFGASPNRTPGPRVQNMQHHHRFTASRSALHVPLHHEALNRYQTFNPQYASTGVPVNNQAAHRPVDNLLLLQRLQAFLASHSSQNGFNQNQQQALLAGGGVGGGVGGLGGQTDGGFGGIESLIQAFTGVGNGGLGNNIPGLDLLGNGGGGLNLLQDLLGGAGGNGFDILGGNGGLSALNGLDLSGQFGGFNF